MSVENSYSLSWIVRQSHHLLHLGPDLKKASNQFDLSYGNYWNDYSRSLLPFPILCGVLGLVAVVAFQFFLLRRSDRSKALNSLAMTEHKAVTSVFSYIGGAFLFFVSLTMVVSQGLVFGGISLSNAVDTGRHGLDYVRGVFDDLSQDGHDMKGYGIDVALNLDMAEATCPYAPALKKYLEEYFHSLNEFMSYVEPIPDRCDDGKGILERWGAHYENCAVWTMYSLILASIVFCALGKFRRSKSTIQVGVTFSQVAVVGGFVLAAIEMIIVMGLGDYCMNPVLNTQKLVPNDILETTVYYTSCEGSNPVQSSLDDIHNFVVEFQSGLKGLYTACPNNPYIKDCFPILRAIDNVVTVALGQSTCPPIQNQFNEVFETSICKHGLEGIYAVWLGLFVSVSCLFITSILSSFLHDYYETDDVNISLDKAVDGSADAYVVSPCAPLLGALSDESSINNSQSGIFLETVQSMV